MNIVDRTRDHSHRRHTTVKTMVAPFIAAMDLAAVGTVRVSRKPNPAFRSSLRPIPAFAAKCRPIPAFSKIGNFLLQV